MLGEIESVSLEGEPLRRRHLSGDGVRLALDIHLAPQVRANLVLSQGEGEGVTSVAVEPGFNQVAFALPAPLQYGENLIQLYLVSALAPATASPRSPVVELVLEGASWESPPEEASVEWWQEGTWGALGEVHRLEGDRWLVTTQEEVMILDPAAKAPLSELSLPSCKAPLIDLHLRHHQSQLVGRCGNLFVDIDLSEMTLNKSYLVSGLMDIIPDANPRYMVLVTKAGELRRYYLRDSEWSQYSGSLPSPPLSDGDGVVGALGEDRVVIATEGALCVLSDTKKVSPHCVSMSSLPVEVALFSDALFEPGGTPYPASRAKRRYRADQDARALEGRGVVLLADGAGEVSAIGADEGEVLWTLPRAHEAFDGALWGWNEGAIPGANQGGSLVFETPDGRQMLRWEEERGLSLCTLGERTTFVPLEEE